MTEKIRLRLLVIILIILSYTFFIPARYLLDFHHQPANHYSHLAQGFLAGQTSLTLLPPTALLNLPDPYDPEQNINFRRNYYLHDMSLYKGKLYLYFGPAPALLFFLPMKLMTSFYPPEAFCVFFFLSLGFIASFSLLIQIKEKYFPDTSEADLLFAGFILGFANNAPFLLNRPIFYEAAIASAFCFMSFAFYFLYGFFNKNHRTRDILLFSILSSLAVGGRPHFALVSFFLIPTLCVYIIKSTPKKNQIILILSLLLPAIIIGTMLGIYNYMRFDSVLEFGQNYIMAGINPIKTGVFRPENLLHNFFYNMGHGFFEYFLHPVILNTHFPFVHSSALSVFPLASHHHFRDITIGVLSTTSFLLILFKLPQIIYYLKNHHQETRPLFYFLTLLLITPILIILFLFSLSIATQRYEVDFLPYLLILAIITFWLIEKIHLNTFAIKVFFILTGLFSIYVGWAINFKGFWLDVPS